MQFKRAQVERRPADRLSTGERAGVGALFLWFLIGGIAHFAFTASEMRIVPPALPWPRELVLITGGFELLGAAGLLWQPVRRAAGIGLLLLTIAVTPANVYMLRHAALFDVPLWALWLRLPLQVGVLALIAWVTSLPRADHRERDPVAPDRRQGTSR